MIKPISLVLAAALAAPLFAQDAAQPQVPVRKLGAIVAKGTENVGPSIVVRQTSQGVLVNSQSRQRIWAFDPTLARATLVVDSGTATQFHAGALIPFTGDSSLLVDIPSQSLLVVGPDGDPKKARAMAMPIAADVPFIAIPAAFGRATLDKEGRLIYRGQVRKPIRPDESGMKMTAILADSSPILRADFDKRTVDTLGWISTPNPAKMSMVPKASGGMAIKMLLNPVPELDEWALLSDGTIAILHSHDYRIDWIDPDGTKRGSPKMPFAWRRFTDEEKQKLADSIADLARTQIKNQLASNPAAAQISIDLQIVPLNEMPDYWPPIQQGGGSVRADLDGNLWILPQTAIKPAAGFVYDVVNRKGDVFERVEMPPGATIAGFAPGGKVYLTISEGTNTYLGLAKLR